MDRNTLVEILNSMLKDRDFSKIVDMVPYEDRYALFMKTHEIEISNSYIYSLMITKIFTEEEAYTLYNQIEDQEIRNKLFYMLSDDIKVKFIDQYEMDGFEAISFLSSINNEKIRFEIACNFVRKKLFNMFSITSLLNKFTGNYKSKILDKIIENYNQEETKLDSFSYSGILGSFDEIDRYKVLKKLIIKSDKFSYMYIDDVLKILPANERMDALNFLLDSFIDEYRKYFYGLSDIVAIFPEDNLYSIIYMFLDKGLLDSYAISELLKNYDLNKCVELIDSLIEYGHKHNRKIITDYVISQLLDRIPRDEGIKVYHKYAITMDEFSNLRIARLCSDVEDKYFYLDYLIGVVKNVEFNKAFDLIDNTLFEIDKKASGENEYANIIDMYARKFEVDRIHLREFIRRFNYSALRFLNSKSIKKVINLDDDNFVRFMNIFNHGTMLNNGVVDSICNSFLQREFRLVNIDDYTIFNQFELLLANKNDNTSIEIAELLVKVSHVVDIDSYFERLQITFDQFVYNLLNNHTASINTLHDITQEYIMKKRETFVNDGLNNIYDDLGLIKKVEKNVYKKKIVELISEFELKCLLTSIPEIYLNDDEKTLVADRNLLERLIKFKKKLIPLEDQNEMKYLKIFESLMNKAYEYKYDGKIFESIDGLPYTYFPVVPTDEWFLGVIVETNVDQILDRILNDKNVYNELLSFLEKYQFLGWEKTFNIFEDRAEIVFNEGTMASIISNFYTISTVAKAKDATLTQFLDYANCYDSLSRMYSYLLGKDNYRAIVANEGRNKAEVSKAERLGRVPSLIRGMYARNEITTPPIDRDFSTSSGKLLNVVLGNSTNMINLSYGERTNSCLRIGGAFNNLFEFCIHDKNGFHVRFSDPNTGDFISRVSGIRNGNTIFFNELRDSVHSDYSNDDLVEILKQLSKELIERTREEECPIENVVISFDYAMSDYKDMAIPTELNDFPNVFYGNRFNIAIDGTFILLESTSSDGKLVPYRFGADLAQSYEPQRDKIVTIYDRERAIDRIHQMHLIDGILKGEEIDNIKLEEISDILICLSGEDWYVYADKNGCIHEFLVGVDKNNFRALSEMQLSLEKLKAILANQYNIKNVGGLL